MICFSQWKRSTCRGCLVFSVQNRSALAEFYVKIIFLIRNILRSGVLRKIFRESALELSAVGITDSEEFIFIAFIIPKQKIVSIPSIIIIEMSLSEQTLLFFHKCDGLSAICYKKCSLRAPIRFAKIKITRQSRWFYNSPKGHFTSTPLKRYRRS